MKLIRSPFFIVLLLGIFSTTILAQNPQIDSLKTELKTHSKKDTTRVNILNSLAFTYVNEDAAKSLEYLDASEIIADSLDFTRGIARSTFLRGDIAMGQSNLDQSIDHYKAALSSFEKVDFKVGISECYAKMGLVLYYKRDYTESIENFQNSIRIDESLGNIKETALNLKYLGYIYTDTANFDEALFHFNKALKINKEYVNKQEIASCLNNLGILFADLSNSTPTALEYYNESLLVSEEIMDSLGMLKALNNMGNLYMLSENHKMAIEKLERSLKIQKNIGNNSYLGITRNNLGNIYKKEEKFEKALAYLTEALEKSRELNDTYTESTTLNNLGGVHRALGNYSLAGKYYNEGKDLKIAIKDEYGLCTAYAGLAYNLISQKKYDEALDAANKANTLSEKFGIIGLQRDVYDLYSRIYKGTGNYKKAFESHERLKLLNDSLFNKKSIEKLASLEYEYKYKRALDSASIRELQLTKTVITTSQNLEKSQRSFLWAIIGFLLVSILLGGIIFYLKFRNIKSETQNIIIEQKLLRSQMTPHFIFNSLSVLQGIILNKEEKKSVLYLSKFSKLLRIILENSRDKMVLLSQELAAIENYLALQNLENEAYKYSIFVADTIDVPSFEIPPMLIQPFVENAIEHAFVDQKENREIAVKLTYLDKKLICVITDNGVGINLPKKNKSKDKSSLATTITSERLKILSKDFKMDGSVTIEDRKTDNAQGTIVTLVIPHKIHPAS